MLESSLDDRAPRCHGTDPDYLVGRLRRERPDLLERLKAGAIASAHAAAVEAGIIRLTTTVRIDDPRETARALARRLGTGELLALADELRALAGAREGNG